MGGLDNCYPDGKGHKCHPLTPVCGRTAGRQEYTAERQVQYCVWNWWAYQSQVISASKRCSCQLGISLQVLLTTARQRLHSGKSLHVIIYVTHSPGSRQSLILVFVTYLLNCCCYRTSTWDRLWHDVGGWLVVGCHEEWASPIVTIEH